MIPHNPLNLPGRNGCIFLLTIFVPLLLPAQSPVTGLYAHWINQAASTTYVGTGATGNAGSGLTGNSYTYKFGPVVATPNEYILDSFTAVGLNYHFVAKTDVYFRRVNNSSVTGLRKSLWFEQSSATTVANGGTIALLPAYDDSLERIFSQGQIFNIGIDNDFENSTNTNNNNIERVDHILPAGVSATDGTKAGFVVFDRGNGGGHDPFYIAAIKSLDAGGNPSAYYTPVLVAASNYGSNVSPSVDYVTFRKNPADLRLLMMNNTATQYRDGVFLTLAALGVANRTTMYGYSLFGTDVTVTSTAALVDYTNSAVFPTGSDYSVGGLDQVAITGLWVTNTSYITLANRINRFSATAAGNTVQLSWTLGDTNGVARVVVQRSADGVHFTSLATLFPSGEAAIDGNPLSGENVYRLQLVDGQGSALAYSTISEVAFSGAVRFRCVPNPATGGQLNFSWQGLTTGYYYLIVVDMQGRVAAKKRFYGAAANGRLSMELGLPVGVYAISVIGDNGKVVGEAEQKVAVR